MNWHTPNRKKKKKSSCNNKITGKQRKRKVYTNKLKALKNRSKKAKKLSNVIKNSDPLNLFSSIERLCKSLIEGDKLFKEPSNYKDKLIINRFGSQSDFLIIEGYKNLVYNALKQLQKEKGNLEKDSHIYPIMFLFRHYLELLMKQTLRNFRLANEEIAHDEVGYVMSHSLIDPWNMIKGYISRLDGENIEDVEYRIFEALINELSLIDKNSFSFRYPYNGVRDVNGSISLCIPEPKDISLDNLEEIIHKMSCFIEGLNDLSYAQLDRKRSLNLSTKKTEK